MTEIIVREGDKIVRRGQKTITQVGAIIALDLLEEIADRLKSLEEFNNLQQCRGEERGFKVSATTELQEMQLVDPVTRERILAHTASIFNDGKATVKLTVNYPHTPEGALELKKGDKQDIDYSKAKTKIKSFFLRCEPTTIDDTLYTTAEVRIHVKY